MKGKKKYQPDLKQPPIECSVTNKDIYDSIPLIFDTENITATFFAR